MEPLSPVSSLQGMSPTYAAPAAGTAVADWVPDNAAPPAAAAGPRSPLAWEPVIAELQRRGDGFPRVPAAQRALEIALALPLMVLTLPVMLLIALIIRLDSPGPVIFRQVRVGRHGRLFRFAKFRTLYVDARQRWPELYAYSYSPDELAALYFKLRDDPRVTRVGKWLRKSTLDELPNLWNVVTGEVALIGPRPEIPEMLPYYDDDGLAKFAVRPGITGLAQVRGRGDLNFSDTVNFDLEYVYTRSVWLDVDIAVRTVLCTVLRKGAF